MINFNYVFNSFVKYVYTDFIVDVIRYISVHRKDFNSIKFKI